jgi:tripartite-type tricarboxylate transporter receptor subunit TctC
VLVDPALGLGPGGEPPACAPLPGWAKVALGRRDVRSVLISGSATYPAFTGELLGSFVHRKEAVTPERLVRTSCRCAASATAPTSATGPGPSPLELRGGGEPRPAAPLGVVAQRPPIVLVWGSADTITPIAQAGRCCAGCPRRSSWSCRTWAHSAHRGSARVRVRPARRARTRRGGGLRALPAPLPSPPVAKTADHDPDPILRRLDPRLLLPLGGSAVAQTAWPERPITMIVPFPPGGVADTVARPIAEALARELKQPVVVENKAGAGGALGIGLAARAPADGYTVLLSLSSISILPEADAVLNRKPAYTLDQFKPIARFTADPTVLVVRADAPWHTLQEFVADMKKQPGRFNYGSSGNYGTMHVPMEMLKSSAGFRMTHIPYTGAGPAIIALLAGQIDAIASGPSTVVQQIQAGKLRPLAHWGEQPLAALPGVPSLAQSGYPVRFAQWSALFVPSKTPDDVVQKLRAAAARAAADPTVRQVVGKAGSPIEYLDAPEFQTYWDADAAVMTQAVRKIGKLE